MSNSDKRPRPLVSGDQILKFLESQGKASHELTLTDLEQALREYRQLRPLVDFVPELKGILVYSDFAHRNRALFREGWNSARLLAVDPQYWHDLANRFAVLAAQEIEELLQHKAPLIIRCDYLGLQWKSSRDDGLSLDFEVLSAEAGQRLGYSPDIGARVRQTAAETWSDFWKYCLWFYRGEPSDSTIANPLKASVNFCLHVALHSETQHRHTEKDMVIQRNSGTPQIGSGTNNSTDDTEGNLTPQLRVDRNQLLKAAQERWSQTAGRRIPFAWIHEAAKVDHKDAYAWKNGVMRATSAMAKSIERVLQADSPPKKPNSD